MAGASIKVQLDTKPAQQDLRKIGKEGQAAAGRVNAKLNRKDSFGGGFAAGAGVGGGIKGFGTRVGGAVRGGFFSAAGDVIGESTAAGREQATRIVGGPDAREQRRTREEGSEKFKMQTAMTGDTSAARKWQDEVLPFRQQVGRAQNQIRRELAPGGEKVKEVEDTLKQTAIELLSQFVKFASDMKNLVTGGNGR